MKRGWPALFIAVIILSLAALLPAFSEQPAGGGAKLPNPFGAPPTDDLDQATNLGGAVNSAASDFGPIISPDGNALYFTSDRPGGLGGQDVWVSYREGGEWGEAKNLGAPINTEDDEGPDSFSLSENALYFTACNRPGGLGKCDLYVSFNLGGRWTRPENLGAPVNTEHNESNASISSNGETLVFASDRPGGLGGTDLWYAKRGEMMKKLIPGFSTQGRWEGPANLGPGVNTSDWDGVGFLMPDNETLYFSSRGRGGSGLADIFRSSYLDGAWTEAENVGDIINTTRDDIYFTLPGSGELAYFSSDRSGGLGMEDVYSIPIPLLVPKCRMVIIRGSVSDEESGSPLAARVSVKDPATSRVVAEVESNPDSGAFQVIVELERLEIQVSEKGHSDYSEKVEIEEGENCAMLTRSIKLKPAQ